MSFSNPRPVSPARYRFEWQGSTGDLVRWDKDKQENVVMPAPFEFIVLDELATMRGFSDADQKQYWSNEVRNIKKEELVVRVGSQIRARGRYADLGDIKAQGAKYAIALYVAHKVGNDWVISKIVFSGAALSAWIDARRTYNPDQNKIVLTGAGQEKKGSVEYFVPTFGGERCSAEEYDMAVALDRDLQRYLETYLAYKEPVDTDEALPDGIEDMSHPSPERKAQYDAQHKANDLQHDDHSTDDVDEDNQRPIDLSDIPF